MLLSQQFIQIQCTDEENTATIFSSCAIPLFLCWLWQFFLSKSEDSTPQTSFSQDFLLIYLLRFRSHLSIIFKWECYMLKAWVSPESRKETGLAPCPHHGQQMLQHSPSKSCLQDGQLSDAGWTPESNLIPMLPHYSAGQIHIQFSPSPWPWALMNSFTALDNLSFTSFPAGFLYLFSFYTLLSYNPPQNGIREIISAPYHSS